MFSFSYVFLLSGILILRFPVFSVPFSFSSSSDFSFPSVFYGPLTIYRPVLPAISMLTLCRWTRTGDIYLHLKRLSLLIERLVVAVHIILFSERNIIFIQQNHIPVSEIREFLCDFFQNLPLVFGVFTVIFLHLS